MKKNVLYIVVLLLISLIAYISIRHFLSEKEDDKITVNGLGYTEDFEQTDPRQVCDYFATKVFHDPERAYRLFNKQYKGDATLMQFLQFRKATLPASQDIISIEFEKAEDGFTNMPSGFQSSEYTYKVKSTDDFQPSIKLEIDVVEEENVYRILRYGVISE